MSKCSFLFVNYIYLIYFTVFNLINHKLLQNFAHVNKNHVEPGTVFTFCLRWNPQKYMESANQPGSSNVGWNTNVLVRILVVISSLLTIYLWVRQYRVYIYPYQPGISITKGFQVFFGYRKKLRITKKTWNPGGAIRCATHASSPQASLKKLIQILHSCKICLNVLFYL